MLKPGKVTKVKVLFLVLVFVFNFDLFKFSAAIFFGEGSIKGTVSRESLQKYKSAKTHLQQWQATCSGAFS